MDDHPDLVRYQAAIKGMAYRAVPFHGVLFRACMPIYANARDLLTGEGARIAGGRWNQPRSMAMVYLATSLEGAIAETLGLAAHFGFDPAARLPMTLVAVDASLTRVLALTDATIRKELGLTLAELSDCPWRFENAAGRQALTQAIGQAASEAGLQGILVSSSVKRSFRNLNVIPSNLGSASRLRIRSADKLPPPPTPGVI